MFKLFKRIYELAINYRTQINISIVLQFFDSMLAFVPVGCVMMFFKSYIDHDISNKLIVQLFTILVIGIIIRTLVRYYIDKHQFSTLYRIFADERIEIGKHLQKVNMGYFTDDSIGSITTVLTTGIAFIEEQGLTAVVQILTSTTSLIIIFMMLLTIDVKIAMIFLITVSIVFVVLSMYYKKLVVYANELNTMNETLTGSIIEYVKNISVIKAFDLLGKHERTNKAFIKRREIDIKGELINIPYIVGSMIIMSLGSVSMIYNITKNYNGTSEILYTAIMVGILSLYVFKALEVICLKLAMLIISTDSLDSIDRLYSQEVLEVRSNQVPTSFDIEFKNVEFAYEDENVINNISFKVEENTMNAIVGLSGSGKSTLVNLIPRFYDIKKGQILIGGKDIRDMSMETLYKNISMVFQNVYLFKDTIYNNIAFGNDNATKEDVIEACKKARCYDFIMQLPQGFDTIVGEAGLSLSGGQRQRVSIARAILKDAPIILLDEATASVDPDNEHEIQLAINSLVEDKTILVIAHKLSCVKNADNILVIDDGKLIQQGTHKELTETEGLYSSLWKKRTTSRSWKIVN